jgi:phage FluMu protein Com
MWSDGEPIDPSPTIDQAMIHWLEMQCARCKTPNDVDLVAMEHPPTTFVHDLASWLRCRKCAKAGRRPSATLLQLAWQPRHPARKTDMCNLSNTTNQAAIIALFRVANRYVGNLAPMPGGFRTTRRGSCAADWRVVSSL